ncbi:MAG TPA: lipoprotein-releasing system ATP-binding protein LolD, partial [Rhodocyclaceae bacterium]|nr:lipoprotein-releasing system ATP-binding protein LolD [Rhodocyclaceae bacterium]
ACLLADEPTGNLDRGTAGAVFDLLVSETASRGAALVLVTHDPGLAERAGRTMHLNDGTITR